MRDQAVLHQFAAHLRAHEIHPPQFDARIIGRECTEHDVRDVGPETFGLLGSRM
jgi:hypothetical protein